MPAGVTPMRAAVVHLQSAAPQQRGNRALFFLVVSLLKRKHRSVPGLVKEDVTRLRVLGDFRCETVELLYSLCINFLKEWMKSTQQGQETRTCCRCHMFAHACELAHLYNVIVKQQPEVVAFHDGDVVSPVWTTAGIKIT